VSKKILIGAPIYDRAWVLPYWFQSIENQNYDLGNVGFIFELGPNDDETHNLLWDWHMKHPEFLVFDGQINETKNHFSHPDGHRNWSTDKYYNMVTFRNNLLEKATALKDQFDYYFSLDSDILLEDPETLNILVDDIEQPDVDVVSPLSYMTPRDMAYPSIMYWNGMPGGIAKRDLNRFRAKELFKVDIVMAAVLMSKKVFTQVRYEWHKQGEDLGFATNLARSGFNSYSDTRVYTPHIMHKTILNEYLVRGFDPRKP
jgi:hypothetical protein